MPADAIGGPLEHRQYGGMEVSDEKRLKGQETHRAAACAALPR